MTPSAEEGASSGDDVTLASYEAAADRYIACSPEPYDAMLTFLDRFAALVGSGTILEFGSGPGRDAAYLESRGLKVLRTDGALAFVDRLRDAGHPARVLDVRTDEFGGPYDGLLASAVLLHLDRDEFVDVLRRARVAVRDEGVFALTLKEGDGQSWSHAKLDLPRRFTYWREPALRSALHSTGWRCLSLVHQAGRLEPWLFVIAQADPDRIAAERKPEGAV